MATDPPRRDLWFLAGVFLTCMCSLMLQIMETRVLSVIGYYHLAFFAIGVAMLGMTAGALAVFYRFEQAYTPQRLFALLCRVMAYFAWSTLASLAVLLSLALSAYFEATLSFLVVWTLAIVVLLPPYILLGIAVSLVLTRSGGPINLIYGVDLLGAAGGCLLTLALLTLTDTYSAIILVGAVGALAAMAFQRAGLAGGARVDGASSVPRSPWLQPGVVAALLLVIAIGNALLGTRGLRPLVVKSETAKTQRLTEERWNSFSRIAMKMRPHSDAFLWSASAIAPEVKLDQGWLNIDGDAGTPIYRYHGDPHELDFLRYDLPSLGYYIRHQGRSAVIGIGGGRDLLTASIFGFNDVTGVEYNPIFVRLFARDYRDFSGAAHIKGLKLYTDDARSWFARSHEQFDLIQMSLIDTWAATGAGAFTLSENGLYTVNGWKRFLARLTPSGIFTVSRWYAPEQLDETARVLSLAMATLFEMGEPDPASHLYLAANGDLSTLLIGRAPLTRADVATLDETVARLRFHTLVAPERPALDPVFEHILHARDAAELVRIGASTPLNLAPTWDSNPFFFNQLRLTDPASMITAALSAPGIMRGNLAASLTLLTLIAISAVVVVVVILIPAAASARELDARALMLSSGYFLVIGVAFMFVEISLIQRMSLLLGHPTYALAIVLFGLILATGVGSVLSGRLVRLTPGSLASWPLLLAAYLALLPLWLGPVLEQAETGALPARAAVSLLTIAPAGILMGFMFPTGMRICERIAPRATPWLWAINGAAGVLASGTAVLVSIETSLDVAIWVGAAGYLLLAAIAPKLIACQRKVLLVV